MTPSPRLILDAHLDIAMNQVAHGRDFRLASWQKRAQEGKFPGHSFDGVGVSVVGLPDMLLGRVGITFATLWVKPATYPPYSEALTYETPFQAYQKALAQLDYYNRLADEDGRVRLIREVRDLDAVLASWDDGREYQEHVVGLVLLMEGADPILEPAQLEEWIGRGLRIVGPAWIGTRYTAGTGAPGRLTRLGHELLDIMAQHNLILDLSHMAEEAYFEALDLYPRTVIASHSNPRRFVDTDRHLSDRMIRALVERDGVIGVVPYNRFMKAGWRDGDKKTEVTVKTLIDMIDHICQIAGDARHVGLGTDWDGDFGWGEIPVPFDSQTDLWTVLPPLLRQRFDEEDVWNILCGNFLRKLREGLPA